MLHAGALRGGWRLGAVIASIANAWYSVLNNKTSASQQGRCEKMRKLGFILFLSSVMKIDHGQCAHLWNTRDKTSGYFGFQCLRWPEANYEVVKHCVFFRPPLITSLAFAGPSEDSSKNGDFVAPALLLNLIFKVQISDAYFLSGVIALPYERYFAP